MKNTDRSIITFSFIALLLLLAAAVCNAADGTLTGKVANSASTAAIAGATVSATGTVGTRSAVTDSSGGYRLALPGGTYAVTCTAQGFKAFSKTGITITEGRSTTLNIALAPLAGAAVENLGAMPRNLVERTASSITLTASVSGTPTSYSWTQVKGPRVPLSPASARSATADVSSLNVAVDTELVFRLTVSGENGVPASRDVSAFIEPADMEPVLGPDVQVGGSTTAVQKYAVNGVEWSLFNIGNKLCATPIGMTKGPVYSIHLPGFVNDIDIVAHNGLTYALISAGSEGIIVVDVTDPSAMTRTATARINYYRGGLSFTEGGGSILTGQEVSGVKGAVAALVTDGVTLYIADNDFGIHRTALTNLLASGGPVLEPDGTLLIDHEVFTLQYAGENPWGRPVDLKLHGGKLFALLKELGLGIFDPVTLEQVGRYNLYTDTMMKEDWFADMDVRQTVAKDPATGEPFVDSFTGMPDFRQTSFEILQVMKKDVAASTPWADFDRYGKFYYKAQGVDFATFNGRTIAYIAYSLGGLVAVDITGFETATPATFLNGRYLGYIPAVPANGPKEPTGTRSRSILPYYGAGMLKESGIVDVKIRGTRAYLTDHFAGLMIIDGADIPDQHWKQAGGPFNNDTNGIPGDHWPDTEFVTSFDMSPYDPLDNESMPKWMYQAPCLLVTAEINGHGNRLLLMDTMATDAAGNIDLLECAGAGGFNFIDLINLRAPAMSDRYAIPVYIPTTDEIGAKADSTAGQTISIGHSAGISASDRYVYVADGPHGVSAWRITDDAGYPTDDIHLVANTLADEYPEVVNGVKIYPASHASNVVFDPVNHVAWSGSSSLGLRRVKVAGVEADLGRVGAPLLLPLSLSDCFEHNAEWGTVKPVQYQDHAYDVELRGNYAFTADGSNGITVYDVTKDPSTAASGFLVANISAGKERPPLGTASGIALWTDSATGKSYAFVAAGPRGVGVVDITDVKNMSLVKVFEPIKLEDGKVGAADGQAVDVKVAGSHAFFSYDSFGVVCYRIADLIAPLPSGISPTDVWKKSQTGRLVYDYRPVAASRFKLQLVPGYEDWAGGAVKMTFTQVSGKLIFYVAFAEAGLLKIDWTDPTAPVLKDVAPTVNECTDVTIANGRLFAADGSGGLVFFK